MNEQQWATAIYFAGAVVFTLIAVWTLRRTPENLPVAEKLPRHRLAGAILGMAALIWCIPHAAVVAPGFLLPWLWPLAIVVPVVSYFVLDYLTARACGGLAILYGYQVVHTAFEMHTPGASVLAVFSWLLGMEGIWISARPCVVRDWIRAVSARPRLRVVAASISGVAAVLLALAAVATLTAGGR